MGDMQKNYTNDFLLYTSADGKIYVRCRLEDETIWLTQDLIAELFGVQRPAITKHLKNIFESGELDEKVVCSKKELTTANGIIAGELPESTTVSKKETVQQEGNRHVKRKRKYYNLDAIISVD
ncbi:MAG: hypothetical protein ACIAQZ_15480 [Sedimentisphaeraceae bacterium JB056]